MKGKAKEKWKEQRKNERSGKERNTKRVGIWTGKHDRKVDVRAHTTNLKDDIWVETPENLKRMNLDIVWIRIV